MLTRLGHVTVRRRRLVLSFTALFMVVAAVLGTRAFGVLTDGGFQDPGAQSAACRRPCSTSTSTATTRTWCSSSPPPVVTSTRPWSRLRPPRSRPTCGPLTPSSTRRRTGTSAHRRHSAASTGTEPWCSPSPTVTTTPKSPRSWTCGRSPRRPRPPRRHLGRGRRQRGRGRHRHDDRGRPGPGRVDRRADHAAPARPRLRQRGRGGAAAGRRRDRGPRHVPRRCALDRLGHRRVDLLDQPHDRAGSRPGHRLLPVHRLPLPGGAAAPGTTSERGRRAHGRDRRAHRGLQRPHRGRVAGRAAGVPALLPALVRLRRHRAWCSWPMVGVGRDLPALLAVLGPPGRRAGGVLPPAAEPRRARGFWHRVAIDASCAGRCRSPSAS